MTVNQNNQGSYFRTEELPQCVLKEPDLKRLVQLMTESINLATEGTNTRSVKDEVRIATIHQGRELCAPTVDALFLLLPPDQSDKLNNISVSVSIRKKGWKGVVTPHLPWGGKMPWIIERMVGPMSRDGEIDSRIIEYRCVPLRSALYVNGENEVWFEGTMVTLCHFLTMRKARPSWFYRRGVIFMLLLLLSAMSMLTALVPLFSLLFSNVKQPSIVAVVAYVTAFMFAALSIAPRALCPPAVVRRQNSRRFIIRTAFIGGWLAAGGGLLFGGLHWPVPIVSAIAFAATCVAAVAAVMAVGPGVMTAQ